MDATTIIARLRAAGCVFAEDEARLLIEAGADDALIARREAGEPLEHLLGWAEFAGLRIAVAPGVFVPRRRTEFLARTAISLARAARSEPVPTPSDPLGPGCVRSAGSDHRAQPGPSEGGNEAARSAGPAIVLDLCAGAGAIAALIAAELGEAAEVHAAELDPAAVACARRTLPDGVQVYEGDLFDAVPETLRGRVEVLVANVPYVPTHAIATMPPEARDHELRMALDGGADGLDLARRVASAAPGWLAPGGHLLIETSTDQAPAATEVFATAELSPTVRESAEFSATVILGRR